MKKNLVIGLLSVLVVAMLISILTQPSTVDADENELTTELADTIEKLKASEKELDQFVNKGIVSESVLHEMEAAIRVQKERIELFIDFLHSKDEFTVVEIKDEISEISSGLFRSANLQAKYSEAGSEAVVSIDGNDIKNIAMIADKMIAALSLMHKKIFVLSEKADLTSMQLKKSISEIDNDIVSCWLFSLTDEYFYINGRPRS